MNSGQQYELYPNPTHGLISLQQMVADKNSVNAEIWNAIGVSIYKNDILFNNGTNQIRLANISPGLYLMKLTDSDGRRFIFKFVEE
jgi:hypothetical protein